MAPAAAPLTPAPDIQGSAVQPGDLECEQRVARRYARAAVDDQVLAQIELLAQADTVDPVRTRWRDEKLRGQQRRVR